MNRKLQRFAQLWQRVKDTYNKPTPKYIHTPGTCNNVKVPAGARVLVLPDEQTYQKLINGLSDAETFTGINYTDILLEESVLINY